MMIIGCDFHPSFQQIAYVDHETGEAVSCGWAIVKKQYGFTCRWRAGRCG
jgi:hypothetical protein